MCIIVGARRLILGITVRIPRMIRAGTSALLFDPLHGNCSVCATNLPCDEGNEHVATSQATGLA